MRYLYSCSHAQFYSLFRGSTPPLRPYISLLCEKCLPSGSHFCAMRLSSKQAKIRICLPCLELLEKWPSIFITLDGRFWPFSAFHKRQIQIGCCYAMDRNRPIANSNYQQLQTSDRKLPATTDTNIADLLPMPASRWHWLMSCIGPGRSVGGHQSQYPAGHCAGHHAARWTNSPQVVDTAR